MIVEKGEIHLRDMGGTEMGRGIIRCAIKRTEKDEGTDRLKGRTTKDPGRFLASYARIPKKLGPYALEKKGGVQREKVGDQDGHPQERKPSTQRVILGH